MLCLCVGMWLCMKTRVYLLEWVDFLRHGLTFSRGANLRRYLSTLIGTKGWCPTPSTLILTCPFTNQLLGTVLPLALHFTFITVSFTTQGWTTLIKRWPHSRCLASVPFQYSRKLPLDCVCFHFSQKFGSGDGVFNSFGGLPLDYHIPERALRQQACKAWSIVRQPCPFSFLECKKEENLDRSSKALRQI